MHARTEWFSRRDVMAAAPFVWLLLCCCAMMMVLLFECVNCACDFMQKKAVAYALYV